MYCTNCGAEMNENDAFCTQCGAPAARSGGAAPVGGAAQMGGMAPVGSPAQMGGMPPVGSTGYNGGKAAKKNNMVVIVAIAVVLVVGFLVIKGLGGKKADSGEMLATGNIAAEENDVIAHLKPWMGEWKRNFEVYPDQGSGLLINYDNEGWYDGHLLSIENSPGTVRVDDQYIDFSDLTNNQYDRYLVSSLTYYKTEYGADAFEDQTRKIRFLFYDHYTTYDGGDDHGKVLKMQTYVGDVTSETVYLNGVIPVASGSTGAPDGWAADTWSFVKTD